MTRFAWTVAWAFVAALFFGFWTYGLFDLDEGLYASALREMIHRGDWLVPTVNDKPFFEKPILMYWTALAALKLGVPAEAALRLPSVLAAIGTLAVVVLFAKRHFGDRSAFWSLCILATSPLYMSVGRMLMPDALFVFFIAAALLAFWQSVEGDLRWRVFSGACLGLATLAKGPVAVVLFAVLLIYARLRLPAVRAGLRGGWVAAAVAFALVAASWYAPVAAIRGHAFLTEFILRQNLGRFSGGDTAHLGPFWFYIPVVLLALAPFSFVILGALLKARKAPSEAYLWAWVVAVFVVFSASGSKLPHYILPLLPPLAMLLADYGVRAAPRVRYAAGAFGLAVGGVALAFLYAGPTAAFVGAIPYALAVLAAACFAGGAAAVWLAWARRGYLAESVAAAAPFALAAMLVGVPSYWHASHGEVRAIAEIARRENLPLIQYRMGGMGEPLATAHPSIDWYLWERSAKTDDIEQLIHWLNDSPKLVLSRRGRLGALERLGSLDVVSELVAERGEFQLYRVSPR